MLLVANFEVVGLRDADRGTRNQELQTRTASRQNMSDSPTHPAPGDVHLDEVRAVFQEFLRARNLRQTPERFAILDEVYHTDGHFDADELFVRLKGHDVHVSRATIYNTLDLLVACDLVGRHQFGDNQAKYEKAYSYWQHDHLICLECGKILEFCDPRIQSIQDTISEIFDFKVKRHSLQLFGFCSDPDCPGRKKEEKDSESP